MWRNGFIFAVNLFDMDFNDASVFVTNFEVTSGKIVAEFYFVSMSGEAVPLYNYIVKGTSCEAMPSPATADNAVASFRAWATTFEKAIL